MSSRTLHCSYWLIVDVLNFVGFDHLHHLILLGLRLYQRFSTGSVGLFEQRRQPTQREERTGGNGLLPGSAGTSIAKGFVLCPPGD